MIAETVLAAVLSLAPVADDAERARLTTFAAAITEASETAAHPFAGHAARQAAGLLLVALAWHESGFRDDVVTCRVLGSRGDATAWQLLGPWARTDAAGKRWTVLEVCSSVPLAAELALHVVMRFAAICRSPVGWLRGYASGRCRRPRGPVMDRDLKPANISDPGLVRCQTWERLAARAGLVGASCWARGPIRTAWSKEAPER